MINYEVAKKIAQTYLMQLEYGNEVAPFILLEEETMEQPFGWIFFYNSKEYVEENNISAALAGNAPFIVDKKGEIHDTGTAYPLEYYINKFVAEL